MKYLTIFAFIVLGQSASFACPRPDRIQVVMNRPHRTLAILIWNQGAPVLAARIQPSASLLKMQEWVRGQARVRGVQLNAGELNRYQQQVWQSKMSTFPPPPNSFSRYRETLLPAVVPAGCLEGILYGEHLARYPIDQFTGEVGAHLFLKGSELRVLLTVGHDPSLVGATPASDPEIRKYLYWNTQRLRQAGYRYLAHFHSHPFNPASQPDFSGMVSPSGCSDYGDIFYFEKERREHGLENFWITNGFETLRVSLRSPAYLDFVKMRNRDFHCSSPSNR